MFSKLLTLDCTPWGMIYNSWAQTLPANKTAADISKSCEKRRNENMAVDWFNNIIKNNRQQQLE